MSAQATPSGGRLASTGEVRSLTGLRVIAAVWVVLFHFHFTPLPGVAAVTDVLGPLVTSGSLGVDLFFVLSGFVIAHTYLDKLGPRLGRAATLRFVWARACRMWPAYALVMHVFGLWLIARLVFGADREIAFQAVQPVVGIGEWLQQVGMVQMWDNAFLDGASWVGPTWSISAEWLAYLLFPLAALGFFRMRLLPAPVLAAGAVVLMVPIAGAYVALGHPYYPWSWLVRVLCGFGAGVLVHLALRRVRWTADLRRRASAVAVALPVVIASVLLLGDLVAPGSGGVVIVLFPLVVGALVLADSGPAMVLTRRWVVYGGRISYSLYLVHIPMFEVYWLALRRFRWLAPDTFLAHALGVVVVLSTFAVAAGCYRLVEEPSRRRLRALAPTPDERHVRPDLPESAVPRIAPEHVDLVAAFHASRRRHGHAVPAPLGAALASAHRRRPMHHIDLDRVAHVRAGFQRTGS